MTAMAYVPSPGRSSQTNEATDEGQSPARAPGKRKDAPQSAPVPGEQAAKRHRSQQGMRVRVVSQGLFSDMTPPPIRRRAGGTPLSQPLPGRHESRWQAGMTSIPMTLPQIPEEELEPGSPQAASPHEAPALPASPAVRYPAAPPTYPRPTATPRPDAQVAIRVHPTPSAPRPASASAPPQAYRPWRTAAFAQESERARELEQLARRRQYGGPGRDPLQALDELDQALRRVGPVAFVTDPTRALSTMEELVSHGVTADQLPGLVSSGRLRDLARTVPASLLTYGASFFLAAGAAHFLEPEAAGLPSDPLAPCPEAGAMPPWLSASLLHLLGDLVIGVGAEWASAVWREGGLAQPYTRPQSSRNGEDRQPLAFAETDAGRLVQYLSALPFGALYIAHRRFPELMGPPLARLGWGAAAATTSGLWREGMGQALAWENDPVWLDGSDPERRDRMRVALRELSSPASAPGQGAQALWAGLIRATGRPDAAASMRALLRTVMALVARGGSLVAAALGRQHDPLWALAADAWLGLSWGHLSTLPARGTQWLASGLEASLKARPTKGAKTAAPQAVAPSLLGSAGPAEARVLTPR